MSNVEGGGSADGGNPIRNGPVRSKLACNVLVGLGQLGCVPCNQVANGKGAAGPMRLAKCLIGSEVSNKLIGTGELLTVLGAVLGYLRYGREDRRVLMIKLGH